MIKKFILLFSAVTGLALCGAAPVDAHVRVEFSSDFSKVRFSNFKADSRLTITHPKDRKGSRFNALRALGKTNPDGSWTRHEITFVPDRFGEVEISLRGKHTRGQKVTWTYYDKFEFEGTTLFNPSFEEVSGGIFGRWQNYPVHLRTQFKGAPHGKNVVAATHDFSVKQTFTVRKGVPVTIRFMAKSGNITARPQIKPRRVYYSNKPKEHYRFYNSKVKYLPLSDKGLPGSKIEQFTPWLKLSAPPKVYLADLKAASSEKKETAVVTFELLEENGIARTADIRFGIPFPQGRLKTTENIQIISPRDKAVPAQFKATALWPDGSVKFLLTDFKAPLKAKEKSVWQLKTGVKSTPCPQPVKVRETADAIEVDTGKLAARISKKSFNFLQDIRIDGKKAGRFTGLELVDEAGKTFNTARTAPRRVFVEEKGPLRLVVRADGSYSSGKASYTARMVFRAGSPVAEIAVTHINSCLDNEFTDIRSLTLTYQAEKALPPIKMDGRKAVRFFQHHDQKLEIDGQFSKKLFSGSGQTGNLTFALRDAAYRYPKAFSVDGSKINFELLPAQPDDKFGTDLTPHLLFPYCSGFYRMKWGMAFTEELKIDFSGQTSPAQLNAMAIVPVIDPVWVARTRVFPGVSEKRVNDFSRWDAKALSAFYNHLKVKAKQREYGFLNYGDWFGERGRNWANNEYDLPHGLFMLFLRTGNRDAYRMAQLGARHQADVDIIKAYPDPMFIGANAQHGIGHTGVSFQRQNPASWSISLDGSFLGTNGHSWTEGMTEAWLMGGDIIPMESALLLGEHLVTYTAPLLTRLGTHERSAGWSSVALMGLYRATGDQRYLNAAKRLINIILEEQKHDLGGAWPHTMPGDHSGGHKETFGNCPYLVGIVLRALREYYQAAPSPALEKAIIAGASWLSRGFDANRCGWPYGMAYDGKHYHLAGTSVNMIIIPGMMAGGRLAKDMKIYEQAQNVLDHSILAGLSPVGKSLSINLCMMPILFDEMNRFVAAQPQAQPYSFVPDKLGKILSKGISEEFRMRGPTKKEFIVKAGAPTQLTVKRQRFGARPKGEPTFNFSVKDPAEKVIFSARDKSKTSKKWTIALPAAGTYTVAIHDDWAGIWHAAGKKCRVYAKILRNYDFSNASISRQYLSVPAGTKKFTLKINGVHQGGCMALLLRPDGSTAGSAESETTGSPLLPWFKASLPKTGVISIDLPAPLAQAETWKLLIVAGGDVQLNIQGIPGYLSLVPVPFDK